MSEWKEVKLGDVCRDGKGTYGIPATAVDFSDELYTYLRITDINDDGTLNRSGLKSVNDENASKYLLKPNDIVFSRTGSSTGKSYFYIKNEGELVYAGFLIKFSLDPQKINPKFFKYYTLSEDYKKWLVAFNTGSTRGNINAQSYANMLFKLPSRKQQDFLVDTLSSIDEMTELNNRTAKVLEEMSQALYKNWFVNFDFPNEEGQPYKSSGGEMVESEIGLIPKGWKIAELGDVTANMREKTKSNDYKVLSAVNTGNLMLSEDYFTKQVFSKDLSKYIIVKQKDFAYNPARVNIGSIGMNEFDFDGCVSPVYVAFRPEEGYHWFFHIYVKSNNFNDEVNKRASGSVRQALNYGDFALIKIAYPPKSVIDKFNDFYEESYLSQKEIKQETQTLINLRDTLLPKLMSGELRVPCEEEI